MIAEDLLARIVGNPDDAAARLVYADAIGGDRGEAIVLAAMLAAAGIATVDDLIFARAPLDPHAAQLRRLLALHRTRVPAWQRDLGAHGLASDGVSGLALTWANGWPAHAEIGAKHLATFAAFARTQPVTSLEVRLWTQADIDALVATGDALRNVREVALYGTREPLDRTALFAAMPALRHLRWQTRAEPSELAAVADHPSLRDLTIVCPTDAGLAALAATPAGQRLARLELRMVMSSADTRPYSPPRSLLRVFAQFPGARDISANWLGLTDEQCERAMRRDFVLAPRTALTTMDLTARGIRALVPAMREVRELDVSGTQLDDATVGAIVDAAPHLARLAFDGAQLGDRGYAALAAAPALRRLAIQDVAARPEAVLAAIDARDLEAVDLAGTADVPLPAALVRGLATLSAPRALRSLRLSHLDIDAADARALGTAPALAGLRELVVGRGPPLGPAARALAALPSLVRLHTEALGDRTSAVHVEHPNLVDLDCGAQTTPAVRAAVAARFGVELWVRTELRLFATRAIAHDELVAAIEAAALPHYDANDRVHLHTEPKVDVRIDADCDSRDLAMALAEPGSQAHATIAAAPAVLDVSWIADDADAEAHRILALLAPPLGGGVVWDLVADTLATIA